MSIIGYIFIIFIIICVVGTIVCAIIDHRIAKINSLKTLINNIEIIADRLKSNRHSKILTVAFVYITYMLEIHRKIIMSKSDREKYQKYNKVLSDIIQKLQNN